MRYEKREEMYRRVSWFVPADPMILEYLTTEPATGNQRIIQSPTAIAANIPYSAAHIRDRLAVLLEGGLVEKTDRGYYRLTDTGAELMAGDIVPEELEDRVENAELDEFADEDDVEE